MLTQYEAEKLTREMHRELAGKPRELWGSTAGMIVVAAVALIGYVVEPDRDSPHRAQAALSSQATEHAPEAPAVQSMSAAERGDI